MVKKVAIHGKAAVKAVQRAATVIHGKAAAKAVLKAAVLKAAAITHGKAATVVVLQTGQMMFSLRVIKSQAVLLKRGRKLRSQIQLLQSFPT